MEKTEKEGKTEKSALRDTAELAGITALGVAGGVLAAEGIRAGVRRVFGRKANEETAAAAGFLGGVLKRLF